MRVVVLGAGAVGAYYGGQLSRAGHEVACYARGANLVALRQHGLEIKSPEGTFHASVAATDRTEKLGPADFAILAVKSYSLEGIASAVRFCAEQGAVIVPLLNGVDTAERLVDLGVPPAAVIGGLTRISVIRVAPGVVERRSSFQSVVVGEFDGQASARVDRIAAAFGEAGADARVSENIRLDLWRKFVFITALAAGCGLARSAIGPLLSHRLGRRLLERATAEVVAVGRARGIPFPDDEATRVMSVLDGLPSGMKPSFLADLESGGPTELDILSGAVSRFAEPLGIATPIHDTATVVLDPRTSLTRA